MGIIDIVLDDIALKSTCTGRHIQIQGTYTKGSAVYTTKLAEGIACCFADAIVRMKAIYELEHGLQVKGLENQLV